VTDLSQPEAPQPGQRPQEEGESVPQRYGDLPARSSAGEPLPQPDESPSERPEPASSRGDESPQRSPFEPFARRGEFHPAPDGSDVQRSHELLHRGENMPNGSEPLPRRAEQLPHRDTAPRADDTLPQRPPSANDAPLARRGQPLPQPAPAPSATDAPLPQRGQPLPQRAPAPDANDAPLPQRGQPLPQRGDQPGGPGVLPRRTTRTRPSGRHRSPHRLSVASDAPALILAVPGSAEADTAEIGPRVASTAGLSCPGVEIRVGYVEGHDLSLAECVMPPDAGSGQPDLFPSVIVPLLLGPSPSIDAVLRRLAGQPPIPAVVAAHLGPHPLVAEALHARLAEAGLARHARSSGLSISADGRGIIVLADKDEQAASAAAVAAVLLASRLSVPVVPASLGDPASIADAVTQLSQSGAPRPALAPCLIGPETSLPVLDDLSAALRAPASATLGAHQAVGQLVAIRYGAALASLSLAG
jgi:hypothetical protein